MQGGAERISFLFAGRNPKKLSGAGSDRYCRGTIFLLLHAPVLNVEKGEILTVLGGLLIVVVMALVANPPYLPGPQVSPETMVPASNASSLPSLSSAIPATVITSVLPVATSPPAQITPYRISYTDKPFSYPAVRLPDRLENMGESDIRRSGQDPVTFAYLSDSRGGLSRVFSVPYPVWTMDIRVFDNTTPNLASFRMALCYAANGTIIDGVELVHPGTAFKRIQTSQTPLYLIISTSDIEGYRIDLQTSRQYYIQYGTFKPG
jgi:hypothetical protein